jgi:hypothetical protein
MCSLDTMLNVGILVLIVCIVYLTLGGKNPLANNRVLQQLNDYEDFVSCGATNSAPCSADNYCFVGSYARTTKDAHQFLQHRASHGSLSETECYKENNPLMKNYPCPRSKFRCATDNHGVNRCEWIKQN